MHARSVLYFLTASVADPDLELREGGGGVGGPVLIYLPCRPFSLQSFLLFLPKIRGGGAGPPGPSPRSATVLVDCSQLRLKTLSLWIPPSPEEGHLDFSASLLTSQGNQAKVHR